MAALSESEIVKSKPIGDGLAAFRDLFRSTCEGFGIPPSADRVQEVIDKGAKSILLNLLLALQSLPTTHLLPSRNIRGTLGSELSTLYSQLDSNQQDVLTVAPLLRKVVDNATDADIWNTVYDLVTNSTPPPPPLPNRDQTPLFQTTSSFVNSSEHRKYVDDVLKDELASSLHIGVPDFYKAFFGEVANLETAAAAVLMKCKEGDNPLYRDERGWHGWPEGAKEKDVLKWFAERIDIFLEFAEELGSVPTVRRRPLAQPDQPLQGSTAERKLDVGFVNDPEATTESRCRWSQILVAGELKSNQIKDNHSETWRDLARHVREVFTAQDTRRFVQGFTLCGSIMRLWEFDRLGGIASSPFNINKDGLQFVKVTLGYLWMSEKQLGFDPTIFEAKGKRYIDIIHHDQKERLVLDELVKRASCVAGRATTCWKAYREGDESKMPLVIKDSWQYPEREEEGELLREATEKEVINVARYYHHEVVCIDGNNDDIRNHIRKGLDITKAKNFRPKGLMAPPGMRPSQSTSTSTTSRKRSSSCTEASLPPSKRTCSSSPTKDSGNPARWNRVHRRVIVSDYGKPLYKASSRVSMLAALEGTIEGYESYRDLTGRLQGDVSIGNLMMNEDKDNPSQQSFLIDLDLAIKEEREEPSGARAKTGTRAFMAIGLLLGEKHSFMHDLESFFWVLFWICVHYNGPGGGVGITEFECWNYENAAKLSKLKFGTVGDEGDFLKTAEESFTAYYKSLIPWVNRLRKVVFPNGGRWKKSDSGLYLEMMKILRTAQKDPKVLLDCDENGGTL